jgi:hypothetical protein
MRPLLAALLFAGFVAAAPVPKAVKKKDDKELIVGTWKPANKGTCWYQFNADGTMQTWHGQGKGSPLDWTWTLDPNAAPKRMKLTRAVGSGVYDCLYELDDDALKIAFIVGAIEPKKVEAAPGLQLYEQARDTSSK